MNQYDLKGKIAVVTGGHGEIGSAIRDALLAAGASVSIWDVSATRDGRCDCPPISIDRITHQAIDQSSFDQVTRATDATVKHFGRIDILVNNAAIVGPTVNLWEYPVDEWKRVIDVVLNGVFYCCRAVVPEMLKNQYGRIVNVVSLTAKEGNPQIGAYTAAKAGVVGMTKSLAKELATQGILVNAIAPTVVDTRLAKSISPELQEYLLSRIPMGRMGKAVEVAEMVAWLASDGVSFSTGAVFDLSGGRATY